MNHAPPTTRVVHIAADGASLTGELTLPARPEGIVLFCRTNAAHVNRSDRQIAELLQQAGFGTLLFDLLTPDEEMIDSATRHLRDDLALLARRLIDTIDWLGAQAMVDTPRIGLFGETGGAAAALVAACVRPSQVCAVVSHLGYPNLAAPVLPRVTVPTLLIVAGSDEAAFKANQSAFHRLRGPKELVMVDDQTHFDQGDSVAEVSRLALGWFRRYLAPNQSRFELLNDGY